jgi:sulfide:quinone oxidoreductase
MKELVIAGGGTAGTLMANRMARRLPTGWRVTVVDQDDVHVYQPGLLFVPFGDADPAKLVRPRGRLLEPAVRYVVAGIDRIDPSAKVVALADGQRLAYDLLVIATGARLRPDQTPGLLGPGWGRDATDFYTLDGAVALRDRLAAMEGGRIVVNPVEMPIKCPVAPLEFLLLCDAHLTKRGVRDRFELVLATPLDGAFTRPVSSRVLGGLLERRGIRLEASFATAEVDGERRVVKGYDGRELPYDLLVSVPLHGGAAPVVDSGLGDTLGFVPTDRHTLAARDHADVFVLGDATDLPVSKAGSVAHFQGEVLTENLLRHIAGRPLLPDFDGHANCFIETGHDRAMLIDFNETTEPLPGRFPLPGIGPFALLEESRINHLGKLAFEWVYWNLLVAGRDLPLEHRMSLAGKWS